MKSQNGRRQSIFNSDLPDSGLRVALYRGEGLVSSVIRWQSRSVYSHAGLMLEDGSVIEAWHRGGVAMNETLSTVHGDGTLVDLFVIEGLTEDGSCDAVSFALDQIGKGYDFGSVLRFLSRRQERRTDSGKWFCSELVFAALEKGGVTLLDRVDPWAVSPGLLSMSPLLRFERSVVCGADHMEEAWV